jgi:hypothetical protein
MPILLINIIEREQGPKYSSWRKCGIKKSTKFDHWESIGVHYHHGGQQNGDGQLPILELLPAYN